MPEGKSRVWRFLLKLTVACLATIGAIVVIAGLTSHGLGLYRDTVVQTARSPDGDYVAKVIQADQLFDEQTLVILERVDGRGGSDTVVTYETPRRIQLRLVWRDPNTLSITLPCEPPNSLDQTFVDFSVEPSRRIIVEAKPGNPSCRYRRGPNWAVEGIAT